SDTINFAGSLAGTTLPVLETLELSGAPATGTAPITIDASALAGGITISNNGFQVDAGVTAVFNSLTISTGTTYAIVNKGILTLNGCPITGSTLVNKGTLQGGTLNFVNGSILLGDGTLAGVTVPVGSDVLWRTHSDFGQTISLTGTITNDGIIELSPNDGENGFLYFRGAVTLAGTGQMLLDPQVGRVYGYPVYSTLTIAAGQTVSSFGAGNYLGFAGVGTVINQGVVEASGAGSSLYMNPSLITNTGTLEAVGGAQLGFLSTTPLDNQGTVIAGSGSTVSATGDYVQTAGTTNLMGGALTVNTVYAVNTFDLEGGTLAGTGTVTGNVANSGGTVTPGGNEGTGVLTINGAYTQSANGTLHLDIGGASSSKFDQLNISGSANINGALNVNLINGFTPAAGQNLAVLTSGSLTGTFATLGLPSSLTPVYSSTAVTLEVPLPSATVGVSAAPPSIQANGQGDFTVTRSSAGGPLTATLGVDTASSVPAGTYSLTGTNDSFDSYTGVLTVNFASADLTETVVFTPNVNNSNAGVGIAQTLQLDVVAGSGYTVSAAQGTAEITVAPSGLVVTNTNAVGPGSLAQAVADANASSTGGTITFATAAKGGVFDTRRNIALAGTLELNNTNTGASISIDGPTAGVTIGGGGPGSNFSVFTVAANTTATLEGLAVTDGYATAGGGITNEAGATLILTNDTIFGNSAAYGAGVDNHGILTLNNDTFVGNSASIDGGGIDNEFATTLTVNNGSMSGNKAGEDGAGIENRGTLTVTVAVLSQNAAQRDGGGINNIGTLTLNGSTLSDNSALNGGGIATYDALTVSTSTLVGNSATSGGGIANFAALTVSASTLVNNSSQEDGGGIFNNGELTVINSTLTGNSAVANGGGVANELAATATVSNATVAANSAANGGGVANISGTLVLNNAIVVGNNATTAPDIAGASSGNNQNLLGGVTYLSPLLDFGGPTETIAPELGSSAIGMGGAVTTLVAAVNNSATTIAVTNAAAIASTVGNYLIQIDGEQMLVTGVNLASNILTVVRGYDGTTPAAHAAQTGIYFPFDQRGVSRPAPGGSPGPDIGAFQTGSDPTGFNLNLVVTTAAGSTAGVADQLSLPAAVNLADELSGNITITFADAPGQLFATPQTINLTAGLSLANSSAG
ncbi:MAG TPA: hypothetical protein VGY66_32290, partial [Gemmataceae bacterium]|nr:hypothetical protein [Gemmataceae bacterium]